MDKAELNEARTNPDFLNYLESTRVAAIDSEDIAALYEVLDTMLVLDLDEQKMNSVYENILKISFERVEDILNKNKMLSLDSTELYYIRSFYEHAIEKWSLNNFDGAKELFFVLLNIIDDEALSNSLKVHLIASYKESTLEEFYEELVDLDAVPTDEKYGYFIMNFKRDISEFLEENSSIYNEAAQKLKHLLD